MCLIYLYIQWYVSAPNQALKLCGSFKENMHICYMINDWTLIHRLIILIVSFHLLPKLLHTCILYILLMILQSIRPQMM